MNSAYYDGFFAVFKPTPLITVDQWAEKHRILPVGGGSEPGAWRNSRTPYLVEIMQALSITSKYREVVFCKGSQVGSTEGLLNWIMYLIDYAPGPIIAYQPTKEDAAIWSKQRVSPSLDQCERLQGKIKPAVSRATGNTILQKDFVGGNFFLRGANTPNAFRSIPAGNIALDEIETYPDDVGKEGSPIKLALRRMSTFARGKAFITSTPSLLSTSKIWPLYGESDKRVYKVPCPHCGTYHVFEFENLKWEKDKPETAMMVCPKCGCFIPEYNKTKMLAAGKWVAQNPGHWRAGFHLSALYSPLGWYSWANAAQQYDDAAKDVEERKVFQNTVLGLPWSDESESLPPEYVRTKIEDYESEVPDGVLVLTMAVDVQGDRLEYEIVGWGTEYESWGIAYGKILGDPLILNTGEKGNPSVWSLLDSLRTRTWRRADGVDLRPACLMIDSGGVHGVTDVVYMYTRAREQYRVFSIKGGSVPNRPLLAKPSRAGAVEAILFTLGVDQGKEMLFSRLKVQNPGPGYCHFPSDESTGYVTEYYEGLVSERKVMTYKKGKVKLQWEKVSTRARNEPIDLRIYNTAAITYLSPNWKVLESRRMNTLQRMASRAPGKTAETGSAAAATEKTAPKTARTASRRPQGIQLASY